MRIGILELLVESPTRGWVDRLFREVVKKQYASLMPQCVAVWCRQLGHEVHYATYYGQRDPRRLIPEQLDVVFLSTYSQASGLAYALAKLWHRDGALTVMGGPHAMSFPLDCLRFFDLVVRECDKTLIDDILRRRFDPGTVVSSGRPLRELPGVEERMPEIAASVLRRGRKDFGTTVPLLTSTGCPYSCDFCVDWNRPFSQLPLERLEADLRFLSTNLPGARIAFNDPNFGVKFDQVLPIMEAIPAAARNPYIIESSLSLLKGSRLQRLKDTRCQYLAPGVENWSDYSDKAGLRSIQGREKLERVVAHFEEINNFVPGLQANFIFGTDADSGAEPVELTKEFILRLPFVWPTVNIPYPFGGTPLFERYLAEDRILRQMPFSFYYTPHLVTTLQSYSPLEYYDHLLDIYSSLNSLGMWQRRMRAAVMPAMRLPWSMRGLGIMTHTLRSLAMRSYMACFRRLHQLMASDSGFRAFHEGLSPDLPEYYHQEFERELGPYAELVSREERIPVLDQLPAGAPSSS